MPTIVPWIKQQALQLGFDTVGIAPAEPAIHLDAYFDWIAAGYHGEQAYLARPDRLARRRDLQVILPGVRSIIVVGLHYWSRPPPVSSVDPGNGQISCYAQGADYHHVMIPRLEQLLQHIRTHVSQSVQGRAYVDTGPLLERDHALQAGLGFIGKNTLLIQPRRGSWLYLGLLLLDLALEPDEPTPMPRCGSCRCCQDACPSGAFVEPFRLDSRRCISYWTTALKGTIPREFRSLMGNHIFGCDVCQIVCPWNRFAEPVTRSVAHESPPLLDLLALTPDDFKARYGHTPVGHIGYERFQRNVAVAAGNWGSPQALKHLEPLLKRPEPLIRLHAAWALGRIGGSTAHAILLNAITHEPHSDVRREISLAVNEAG
jgi:epoxyqueuosine reductase